MTRGNGGIIGARRVPSAISAGGVWSVRDAYTADRDAQWPRWPLNIGIPFDSRLRMWLEADYGLYQDVDATVPVTADNQPVRSWVNRGNSGKLVNSRALAPVKYAGGAVYFSSGELRAFDKIQCSRQKYNYAFAVARVTNSANPRAFISNPETTQEAGSEYRLCPAVGATTATTYVGRNNTSAMGVSASGDTRLSAQLFGLTMSATGAVEQVVSSGGTAIALSPATVFPPPGQAGIVVGGLDAIASLSSALYLRALIWYSADAPMSVTEVNLVYAYLGAKYGVQYPVLA